MGSGYFCFPHNSKLSRRQNSPVRWGTRRWGTEMGDNGKQYCLLSQGLLRDLGQARPRDRDSRQLWI
jgi:hypothetical protein